MENMLLVFCALLVFLNPTALYASEQRGECPESALADPNFKLQTNPWLAWQMIVLGSVSFVGGICGTVAALWFLVGDHT
jgi:hypothetical protein